MLFLSLIRTVAKETSDSVETLEASVALKSTYMTGWLSTGQNNTK
jgi:hypothetical protein